MGAHLGESLESWYASIPKLPPPPTAVFASAHALSELDLLREHCRWLPMQQENMCVNLDLPMSSVFRKRNVYVENAVSQVTYVGEDSSTSSGVQQMPRTGVKNEWRNAEASEAVGYALTSCWPRHDPAFIAPNWCSVLRPDSLCPGDDDQSTG